MYDKKSNQKWARKQGAMHMNLMMEHLEKNFDIPFYSLYIK